MKIKTAAAPAISVLEILLGRSVRLGFEVFPLPRSRVIISQRASRASATWKRVHEAIAANCVTST